MWILNFATVRSFFVVIALLLPIANVIARPQPAQPEPTMTPEINTGPLQQPPQPEPVTDAEALSLFDHNVYLPAIFRGSSGGGGNQPPTPTGPTIIDQNSVALFERIPDRYLTIARSYRMLFADRSVGQNINESLDCLTAASWAASSASCRRDYYNANWDWRTFGLTDLNAGTVPSRISFTPSPTRYNRSNWTFVYFDGTWYVTTERFINEVAPSYLNSKDILSYQFSYLAISEDSTIASPMQGFFVDSPARYDIGDLEAFWRANPNKTFYLWTTSLARGAGTTVARDFNNQMRQYGIDHNMFVFDVAAIESHTDTGAPCYDNRDGVPACNGDNCENFPDDNQDLPAICRDYTTEIDGGHLGSVSAGRIRIAKAFWVLMARMAGWDGVSQ